MPRRLENDNACHILTFSGAPSGVVVLLFYSCSCNTCGVAFFVVNELFHAVLTFVLLSSSSLWRTTLHRAFLRCSLRIVSVQAVLGERKRSRRCEFMLRSSKAPPGRCELDDRVPLLCHCSLAKPCRGDVLMRLWYDTFLTGGQSRRGDEAA